MSVAKQHLLISATKWNRILIYTWG